MSLVTHRTIQTTGMTTEKNESLIRVFCSRHKVGFRVLRASRIMCETEVHELARNFPYDNVWEYCCDCRTYSASETDQRHDNCSSCELAVVRRYFCDECHVMSIECDGLTKRRDFTIPRHADESFLCPGCLQVSNLVPIEHRCDEESFSYTTARAICPFCDEVLIADGAVRKANVHNVQQKTSLPDNVAPRELKAVEARAEKRKASKTGLKTGTAPVTATTRKSGDEWSAEAASSHAEAKVRWLIIGGVLLIFLTAAILGALSKRSTTTNTSPDSSTPQSAQRIHVPAGMVRVPGGEFLMGNDAGDEYEKPTHRVQVEPFLIDANEVTCEAYLKFVKETNHRSPQNWVNGQFPRGAAKQPVTGVDWDDATAYANWAGKRLPTEKEWEFAARGPTGWRYPWGNDWRENAANAGNSNVGRLADVGSYPNGKGPFGTMDMIGNAWEWTATEWQAYPKGTSPPDGSNRLRVIRGGYWGSSVAKATTTFRRGWDARGAEIGYQNTGFRCAADVNPQTK